MAKFNVRNFFSNLITTGTTVGLKNLPRAAKLKSGVALRPLFTGNTNKKHSDKFWKDYGVSTMKATDVTIAGTSGDTYSSTTVMTNVKFARQATYIKLGRSNQG